MFRPVFPGSPAPMFSPPRRAVLLGGLLLLAPFPAATRAQAPGSPAAQAFAGANNLFNGGQYAEARDAYAALLKNYPSFEAANAARLQLATAQFLTAQFDPAIKGLRELLASPTMAGQNELLEGAAALLPEALAQRATALPPTDPAGRNTGFADAVKEYGAFLERFPRAAGVPAALYGRSVAQYQISKFPEAVTDLRRIQKEFPNAEIAGGGNFLLALTLATQGREAANAEPPRTADAGRSFDEAERLLAALAGRADDLALANDARLQLGEVLAARAAADADERTRADRLARALDAFQSVETKAPIVAAQTARINDLKARLRASVGNPAALRGFQQTLVREATKLGSLQGCEDDAVAARLRAASVFVQLRRYDEARTLARALAPLATKPADEKTVLYTVALTLAAQRAIEPAVGAYEAFQAKFAGDPVAENLPLLVGAMFLSGARPDPARAIEFFDQFGKLYPNSKLRGTALAEQASALARQGKFDEALAAFDNVLGTKPKPELAAAAALGRARVLQQQGDLPGALAGFRRVRGEFPARPEAVEAGCAVGTVLLAAKDAPGAVNELKAFVARNPASPLTPNATLTLARAQQAAGDKPGALATLAELPGKFPRSPEAPASLLLRASLLYADKNTAEMTEVLQEFARRYPDDPKLYEATETLAAVQAAASPPQTGAAVATLRGFLERHADSPRAPDALLKIANLQRKTATDLGRYLVLGADQREVWKKGLTASIATAEELLDKHPDAGAPVALVLTCLLDGQRLLADAKLKTDAEIPAYCAALAERHAGNPALGSRIRFRGAALQAERDPAGGIAAMRAAFDPALIYSPADLDTFAGALLRAGDAAAAAGVLEKAARDYPLPAGVAPAQAAPDVQEAQALALYGQARLAEAKADHAGAAALYGRLKAEFPRSPKLAEANLGLARPLVAAGKFDDALRLLSEVARAPNAPLETRARGILLTGEVFERQNKLPEAIDALLKVAVFYPGAATEAGEGLWRGSGLLERQAAGLSEATRPKQSEQRARGRKALEDLVAKYPATPHVGEAKSKLAAK